MPLRERPVESYYPRDVVRGGILLDDLDLLVSHLLGELFVDWGQLLALAAPRTVELTNTYLFLPPHHGP